MSNGFGFNEFYSFSSPNVTGSPERNLLLAILERAILDLTGNDPELANDAEVWLFEDLNVADQDPEEFTLMWVCQQLDLNVVDIISKIRRMPRRGNSRVPPWYMNQTASISR